MFEEVHIEVGSAPEISPFGSFVGHLKHRYRLSSATTHAWEQMLVDRFDAAIAPAQITAAVFVWGNTLDLMCSANDLDYCFELLIKTIEVTNRDYSTSQCGNL